MIHNNIASSDFRNRYEVLAPRGALEMIDDITCGSELGCMHLWFQLANVRLNLAMSFVQAVSELTELLLKDKQTCLPKANYFVDLYVGRLAGLINPRNLTFAHSFPHGPCSCAPGQNPCADPQCTCVSRTLKQCPPPSHTHRQQLEGGGGSAARRGQVGGLLWLCARELPGPPCTGRQPLAPPWRQPSS